MEFSIYSIGDGTFLTTILNSVAMIFGHGSYVTLISIGLLLGVFAVVIQGLFRGAKEIHWQQILLGWIVYACMFVPTCTVWVEDAYDGTVRNVDNVPIGVGFSGAMISNIGYGITEIFEQAYGDVAALTQKPFLEPLKILNAVRFTASDTQIYDAIDKANGNANIRESIHNYVSECVMPKVALRTITPEQVVSQDALAFVMPTSSKVLGTYINTTGTWENLTCAEAWPKISAALNQTATISSQVAGAVGLEGKAGVPADINAEITSSLGFLQNVSSGAQNFIKVSLIEPVVVRAQSGFYKNMGDVNSALMVNQAIEQRNTQWAAEATLFNTTVRPFLAFFEGFMFAITPNLAFLIVTGGIGMMLATKYVQLIFWIQLWYPVLSIVNLYIVMAAQGEINGISMVPDSFYALNKTAEVLQTWIATGGMLAAATPVIALFLVTGSTYAFTSLTNRMQGADHLNEKITTPDTVQPSAYYAGETVGHGNSWTGAMRTGAENVTQTLNFGSMAQNVMSSAAQKSQAALSTLSNTLMTSYSDSATHQASGQVLENVTKSLSANHSQAVESVRNAIQKTSWGRNLSTEQQDQLIGAIATKVGGSGSFSVDTAKSIIGNLGQKLFGISIKAGGDGGLTGQSTSQDTAATGATDTEAKARELAQSMQTVDTSALQKAMQSTMQTATSETLLQGSGLTANDSVGHQVASSINEAKSYSETASMASSMSSATSQKSEAFAKTVMNNTDARSRMQNLLATDDRLARATDERAKVLALSLGNHELARYAAAAEVLSNGSADDQRTLLGIASAAHGLTYGNIGNARAHSGMQGPGMYATADGLREVDKDTIAATADGVPGRIDEMRGQTARGQAAVMAASVENTRDTLATHAHRGKLGNKQEVLAAATAFEQTPPEPAGLDHPYVIRFDEARQKAVEAGMTSAQADAVAMYATSGGAGEDRMRKALFEENHNRYGFVLDGDQLNSLTDNMMKHARSVAEAGPEQYKIYADKFRALNESRTALGETPGTDRNFR